MFGVAVRGRSPWRTLGSVLALIVAGLLIPAGLSLTTTAAHAATVDTNTWYVLVNQLSGRALDVATRGIPDNEDEKVAYTGDGAKATTYTRDGTASQQWKFVDAGSGYYKLKNRYSGKILDVPAFSTAEGTVLDQWGDSNGTNVQFRVEDAAGGSIRLVNRNSAKAVSGSASSFTDGTQVVQSTDVDAARQRWVLVPANVVDPGVWYELVNESSGRALSVLPDPDESDATDEDRLNGRKIIQSIPEQKLTQQWQLVESGNGYYRLSNKKSDKVLDLPGFSTANGTVLDQWSDANGTNQQFRLEASGDGVFRLVNSNSNKAVTASSTAEGADVVQSTDTDSPSQRWRLVPVKPVAWHVLVNQNSGKVLQVANAATTNGAKVIQATRDDTTAQQWQVLDAGDGYYKLRNRNSGKVLDVPAFSTAEGTVLDQWGDTHGTNVQFRVEVPGAGLVQLINRNSGKAVSVSGASTADGADVVQSADADGTHQRWRLLPVDSAAQVSVDTAAWYVLVNRNSGKALDVAGDATTDGAKATQWTRDDLAPQQWKFVDAGNGYYKLRNRNSGKVLDVPAFSTADGVALDQWTETTGANVQFRLAESADGLVRLINRNSGKAVGIASSSTSNGADVVQSTDLNKADQQWMLYPVDSTATTTVNPQLWYVLVNVHSGKALDNYGLRLEDGAKVAQFSRNDGYWQQWQFVPSGGGHYRLRNRHSNKVLNVWQNSTANGALVKQYSDVDAPNEQFRIVDAGGGNVQLIAQHSDKALEVYNWSTANGADIVQWTDLDGANQQWQLIPVGGTVAYPRPEPVFGGDATHDPTVLRRPDGTYLMTGTAMVMMMSDDRVTWTQAGEVFPDGSPAWTDAYTDPASHMLWAPDLSYHNGTYYLYYSASTAGSKQSAIGLATSTTGAPGTWVDQGKVLESNAQSDFNAIDPNLIVDGQGRWWLTYGSYVSGIKLVEINPTTGMKLNSTVHSIASRNDGIEPSNDWYGRVEAPYIVRHGSYYYLYVSFDGCCAVGRAATYRVAVGRSTGPTGPYVDRNGTDMMDGGGTEILASQDGALYGPGHQAVLHDTDGDILFYHYYAANQDGGKGCNYCKFGFNHIGYDSQDWPFVY